MRRCVAVLKHWLNAHCCRLARFNAATGTAALEAVGMVRRHLPRTSPGRQLARLWAGSSEQFNHTHGGERCGVG